MKRILLFLSLLAATAAAQNYTAVTATNFTNALGTPLDSGTITFIGVNQANVPIPFQVGGGGQAIMVNVSCVIVTGAITVSQTGGACQLPNPQNTSPEGVGYRVAVVDNSTGATVYAIPNSYQTVPLNAANGFYGSTFSFDTYQPGGQIMPPPTPGTLAGSLQITGNLVVNGTSTLPTIIGTTTDTSFFVSAGSGSGGLAALIMSLGSTPATVTCNTPQTLTANLTIPATITFAPQQGCVVTLGIYNVYQNGPLNAGLYQIWNQNSTGRVYFGWNGTAPVPNFLSTDYPEWWGCQQSAATFDCAPAVQSAIRAWPGQPSSGNSSNGGFTEFQTSAASQAGNGLFGYYLGSNLIIDRPAEVGGATQSSAGEQNGEIGPRLIFAPGFGAYTSNGAPAPSDGGGSDGFSAHDITVSCASCLATTTFTAGSNQVTVSNPSIFAVNDLVTVSPPTLPFPTYVTGVSGSTITFSNNAIYNWTNANLYVAATSAQMTTATFSTSSCTVTGVGNINEFHAGQSVASPALGIQGWVQTVNYTASTMRIYGAGGGGACNAALSNGTSDLWPFNAALSVASGGRVQNFYVTGGPWGGPGLEFHGDATGSPFTAVDDDEAKNIHIYHIGGTGIDIQGGDANAMSFYDINLGSAGLDDWHNTGADNHVYHIAFESAGLHDINDPGGSVAFYGEYDDGSGPLPNICGGQDVVVTSGTAAATCNGATEQQGNYHRFSAGGGLPEIWLSNGALTATATIGSTCLTNVQDPALWAIGAGIISQSAYGPPGLGSMIPANTVIAAIGSCSGSNSLTLSNAAQSNSESANPGNSLSATIDIAPDYAVVENGPTQGSASGLGLLSEYDHAQNHKIQWFYNPNPATSGASSFDLWHSGYWGFGDPSQWSFDISTVSSYDNSVPQGQRNELSFWAPHYIGSSLLGSNTPKIALGQDALANGQWPKGSAASPEWCRPGDVILNASVSASFAQDDLYGWQCQSGGFTNLGLSASVTSGSNVVSSIGSAGLVAPGVTVTGTGIPRNTFVECVYNTNLSEWLGTIVTGCTGTPASETAVLNNVVGTTATETLTFLWYGKIHNNADTLTTTSTQTTATASGTDWNNFDYVKCANCASFTYLASGAGTPNVVLSQAATGSSTVSAYDAQAAQIPEGPTGAQVQVALSANTSTISATNTSNPITLAGITSSSHCVVSASNSAASLLTGVYVVATTNTATVHFAAAAGGEQFTVLCTPN